ncbi:MAG: Clp protease ClpP [Dehalococcoidia bacterium]|nr:Clp protease ClpP [Dehalococcoidia bacterium]
MNRTWYEIRDAADGAAEVLLYDEIGSWGITAAEFVKDLRGIKANTINLRVNSPGGDVFDGVAIYNSLKSHKAAVNVVVEGLAASSASFITQAGDTVLMAAGSTMMIHEPHGLTMGDAGDMAKMAETLDKMGDTIASLYAGRAGGTEAEWRDRMRAETWYRAQEAVTANLADGLVQTAQARNQMGIFNLSQFRNVPDWVPQAADSSIQNPYPNEHACRLRDPGDFQPDSFRRTSRDHEGKRYDVIMGRPKGESTMAEQAYRYPKDTWDAGLARSHCEDHDGSFEAASGDQADAPPSPLMEAVKEGVAAVVKKPGLPPFDFKQAVKAGTAREGE